MSTLSAKDRRRLADLVKVDEQYLYQCLTGRRAMDAAEAVRIERDSRSELRRWHLRPKDWHRIWPELVGHPGAPSIEAVPQLPLDLVSEAPAAADGLAPDQSSRTRLMYGDLREEDRESKPTADRPSNRRGGDRPENRRERGGR
jgi:DNA-binding transcriptional regulator YdaS (Cro superfamily)